MAKFICLIFCATVVIFNSAKAFSTDEKKAIHEAVKPVVAECAQKHGVTQEQLKAALEAGKGDNVTPCFFSCAMKKTGMFNEQGMYNTDTAVNVLKNIVKEEDLAKYQEKSKICGSVNTQTVSDGEAGCDRAKLLLACFRQNGIEVYITYTSQNPILDDAGLQFLQFAM